MIYAIRAVGTDFIKIGFTDDASPDRRLGQLQVGCPFKLEVDAFGEGSEEEEQAIHAYLAEDSERGEWFRLTPRVQAIVEEMKNRKARVSFIGTFAGMCLAQGAERAQEALKLLVHFPDRDKLPMDEHRQVWDIALELARRHYEELKEWVENRYGRQKGDEAQAA